jgi:hypothetical protein
MLTSQTSLLPLHTTLGSSIICSTPFSIFAHVYSWAIINIFVVCWCTTNKMLTTNTFPALRFPVCSANSLNPCFPSALAGRNSIKLDVSLLCFCIVSCGATDYATAFNHYINYFTKINKYKTTIK